MCDIYVASCGRVLDSRCSLIRFPTECISLLFQSFNEMKFLLYDFNWVHNNLKSFSYDRHRIKSQLVHEQKLFSFLIRLITSLQISLGSDIKLNLLGSEKYSPVIRVNIIIIYGQIYSLYFRIIGYSQLNSQLNLNMNNL